MCASFAPKQASIVLEGSVASSKHVKRATAVQKQGQEPVFRFFEGWAFRKRRPNLNAERRLLLQRITSAASSKDVKGATAAQKRDLNIDVGCFVKGRNMCTLSKDGICASVIQKQAQKYTIGCSIRGVTSAACNAIGSRVAHLLSKLPDGLTTAGQFLDHLFQVALGIDSFRTSGLRESLFELFRLTEHSTDSDKTSTLALAGRSYEQAKTTFSTLVIPTFPTLLNPRSFYTSMSVAQKSMPPQQAVSKKEGRPQPTSNISAMAKAAAQNSIHQQHSNKRLALQQVQEITHQGTGLPSPRASLDNLRNSSSGQPELDNEEGVEDYHYCQAGCDHDDEGHTVVLNDTGSVLEMDLDSHPGSHTASLVVTSPRGARLTCTRCGLNFRPEFDRRASVTDSIASLTRSIRSTSEDGHDGLETSDVNELIVPTLAHRFQTSRVIMEMSRFQLKVALAFYMNRLAEFEAQESIAHRLLHSANSKDILHLWHSESTATEEVVIQGMPTIALMLGHSVSLLTPYVSHLSKLKSSADMRELESRVDGLFVRADPAHMDQELEARVQAVLAGQGHEDKVEKTKLRG
ncbi:hypothetical protein BKA70DRAFT_1236475 [Coprinopsis sp. MPI-PUGE-AT-0042]|nr:hypothetical protein BKA70DRAFT_1236475 [Coprinopsis sp. MPI-PUGE-AT-0042]